MYDRCPACHLAYQRESGFYLGAIYVNYGVTAAIGAIAYPVLLLGGWLSRDRTLAVVLTFVVLFPIWFFRYARSLWLAFDQWIDPQP